MNVKNIIKVVALAMLMPAMMLNSACSNEDEPVIGNENAPSRGYPLYVSVNATRQGDEATTRAEFGADNKLHFTAGDQLFVKGSATGAGSFAGTLDYVPATGKFSGTIYTELGYSGTAQELFGATMTSVTAYLIPDGYGKYFYLGNYSGNSYNDNITFEYPYAFAETKKLAVEQLSYEQGGYDKTNKRFVLNPFNAILNFTITGLAASTEVEVVFNDGTTEVNHRMSTNASGTATFAIGVPGYVETYSAGTNLNTCTLTVAGNPITLVSSDKTLTAGKIYNISRSVTPAPTYTLLSAATTSDYGKVVCAAGHLHDAKTAVPAGCTAVGILGKVTETGRGLILALKDATSQNWNTINGWTSTTTYAGTTLKVLPDAAAHGSLTSYTRLGTTAVSDWAVAQKSDYEAIFTNLGSTTGNSNGTTYDGNVNAYITTGVGGTAISGNYWSATDYDSGNALVFISSLWGYSEKTNSVSVRPVLGFGPAKLLSAATTSDVGKVVCADGHLRDAKTAVPAGGTAVGILGKVTETGHGLILALQDAPAQQWSTINGWKSVTYAGTTLKVLPNDAARGANLTSYTTLGSTAVSNWAVAQKSDYEAIFTNLGSTTGNSNGKTYDANVNAYITTGVGGTALPNYYYYWSATAFDGDCAWNFRSDIWGGSLKTYSDAVRPVLGF